MKIRADIAELLATGWTDRKIATHCHVHTRRVREARKVLGIPTHKPGPTPAATVEDLFWRRAQHTNDGHLLWPAVTRHIRVGHGGPRISAARIAFRMRHHREPIGKVRAGCGQERCVHPSHVEDQPMRETFAAIFGGTR